MPQAVKAPNVINFNSTIVGDLLHVLSPEGGDYTLTGDAYAQLRTEPRPGAPDRYATLVSYMPNDSGGQWLLAKSLENTASATKSVVHRLCRLALNTMFKNGAGDYFGFGTPEPSKVMVKDLQKTTAIMLSENPAYLQRLISEKIIPGTLSGQLPYTSHIEVYKMLRAISAPEVASNPDKEAERKSLELYEHIVVEGRSVDRTNPDYPAFRLVLGIKSLASYSRSSSLKHFLEELQTLSVYSQCLYDSANLAVGTFAELALRAGDLANRLTVMSAEADRLLNAMRRGTLIYGEALDLLGALRDLNQTQSLYVLALAAYLMHTERDMLLASSTAMQILESMVYSTSIKADYLSRKSKPQIAT